MQRVVVRTLPDGSVRNVRPFHVCLKGLEDAVLCREDEDCDVMVKVICISARRCNVIVIIYAVVSNHCHIAVLAASQEDADRYGQDIKKVYSMFFSRKYGERGILRRVEMKALPLENDWHTRNVLAYIPRNALDNGGPVDEYKWSGYRAMFRDKKPEWTFPVSMMKSRDKERILHTGESVKGVAWVVNRDGELEPFSFCDSAYLEQVFNGKQSFFLQCIGGVNTTEMAFNLEVRPYTMVTDAEFLKSVEELSRNWFKCPISALSQEQRARIIYYVRKTHKTSTSQLARVFRLPRSIITQILGKK